ncbi:hypothetical protein BDQ12DRAFT_667880 [Crucibulum laeve]|uniref:Chromatin modification-related protein n=1 Tax=Crucibulum laeve TaxID=68775 RepID=A0A5C3M5S1_9AGAR|nr:hypothetical protein BDQ12DRAFT_667880 [Crucibulum laeve]
MSIAVPNFEEAAAVASEFIYSIDNLPHEVSHLLQEIKLKEARVQDLQHEIDRDSAKYIRHSVRSSISAASSAASTPGPSGASPAPAVTPKPSTLLLPTKIAASYAEINTLAEEKCLLAQRLIDLIALTRSKLESEIVKVRVLQGEVIEGPATLPIPVEVPVLPVAGIPLSIGESLKNALLSRAASPVVAAASPTAATSISVASIGGSANKKRKTTATTALKMSPIKTTKSSKQRRSASPAVVAIPPASAGGVHQRSRLSRQILPEPDSMDVDAEGELEAEGEADAEGVDDAEGEEDERLYCFCQKHSYGDMIACDNEGCPYEWFHLSCVGMKQPLPDKWYCQECKSKGAGVAPPPPPKKGRKK